MTNSMISAYYRGNVYTKNVISEDGTVDVIGIDDIEYDTLSNGKVVAKGLPGQLAQVPIEDNDAYLRTNYDTSNNINFRDGDKQSTRYFDDFEDDESTVSTTDKMYDSPKHMVGSDDNGTINKEYDKSDTRTSLINDEVRVYKEGLGKIESIGWILQQEDFIPKIWLQILLDLDVQCQELVQNLKTKENEKIKNLIH